MQGLLKVQTRLNSWTWTLGKGSDANGIPVFVECQYRPYWQKCKMFDPNWKKGAWVGMLRNQEFPYFLQIETSLIIK